MYQEAMAAHVAALQAQQSARVSGFSRVLGVNLAKYAKAKVPGFDQVRILFDPPCMLKDADRLRAAGNVYIWRMPDNPITRSLVRRQVLRPVNSSELDPESPYAIVDRVKIHTSEGPREVIRTPGGLGLFVCEKKGEDLTNIDQGLLPGDQWEAKYAQDLMSNEEEFRSGIETISRSSTMGRVHGSIDMTETQREPVI